MPDHQQSIHPVLKKPIDSFHYWDHTADRMVNHLPSNTFTIVAAIKNEGNYLSKHELEFIRSAGPVLSNKVEVGIVW